MDYSFPVPQTFSGTTDQPLQFPSQLSDVVIYGLGDKGFQFNSEGVWKPADTIIDNGMQCGYSVYYLGVLVSCGRLAVYDEIDGEMDILNGGPISCGWVTHFPVDYVSPPDDILARYQESKKAFRKDFITWPVLSDIDAENDIASSVGQSIYRLAASDPFTQYGLGEIETSYEKNFSVGFDGTSHRFPTITSDLSYYPDLLLAEQNPSGYPCLPTGEIDGDAASDVTLGRDSD